MDLFRVNFLRAQDAMDQVRADHLAWLGTFRKPKVVRRLTKGPLGDRNKTRAVLSFLPLLLTVGMRPTIYLSVELLEFREVPDDERRFAVLFRKGAVFTL